MSKYTDHEKIAGHDKWWEVIAYRIVLFMVDFISIAQIFATLMIGILVGAGYLTYELAKIPGISSNVLITMVALDTIIFLATFFALVYWCARKYAPRAFDILDRKLNGPVQQTREEKAPSPPAETPPAEAKAPEGQA